MVITELSEQQSLEVLGRAQIARLGCSHDDQPYIIPLQIAYADKYVYVLSTYGQKIEWMRENPKVCLEVEEGRGTSDWKSVIVYGTYQELTEPRYTEERELARLLLQKHNRWWLVAFAERQAKTSEQLIDPIYFRVEISSVSGLKAE
jgi:nitroimidazol reductase NimA-like FMN-containing flavoprotein (pyridoxamine 5'-phosphate oxidase superfamily)